MHKAQIVQISYVSQVPDHEDVEIVSFDYEGKPTSCVVGAGRFKPNSSGVYIPPYYCTPVLPMWDFLSQTNHRVTSKKIAGVTSEGLLLPSEFFGDNLLNPHFGSDITARLNLSRYYPSCNIHVSGQTIPPVKGFHRHTRIRNFNHFHNLSENKQIFNLGDQVVITELVDGIGVRFGIVDGEFYVGSKRVTIVDDGKNIIWRAATLYRIKEKLLDYYRGDDVSIYGTLYGYKLRPHWYGKDTPGDLYGLVIDDVFVGDKYLDFYHLSRFTAKTGLPLVPVLYRGSYNEMVLGHVSAQSQLCHSVGVYGIVVRSNPESRHKDIGRKILKLHA